MRVTATRGTQGRPSTEEVIAPPKTNAEHVKRILLERRKELGKLFPRDGEGAVFRAIVLAMDQARRLPPSTSPESIAECAIAAMKLDLDSSEDCYFVPYKGKAKLIVGPQGLIKLGYRSGFVKSAVARFVLDGDDFEYRLGSDEYIHHKRASTRPLDPDGIWAALVAAYYVIETTTGGKIMDVLERGDIEYYRSLSPSGSDKGGLWGKFPAEAARKSALKQGFRFVPHSAQLSIALREDPETEGIEIPADIWAALRAKEEDRDVKPGNVPQAVEPSRDEEQAYQREPGEDSAS